MGISFSCSADDFDDLERKCETVFVRSISFKGGDVKTMLRSVSFNGKESESTTLKSLGSGRMIIQGSLSFKRNESDPFSLETTISIKTPVLENKKINPSVSFKSKEIDDSLLRPNTSADMIPGLPLLEPSNPKHAAAVKLQKFYKSFRTRRQLADCAVLVEQRWWKLLDFAVLKRSSVSFFDIDKPESAFSRWSRARTRAAMVGKGLSKDDKAQKLALQHWLEAIDPRHRYGHNLHFYYRRWLRCDSKQPFFYWLDVGEGREVNLDQCPRPKLQHQCIKYLGPKEREVYEVIVKDGKFLYMQSGKLLDTSEGPKDIKWIFVLSTSKRLYVGQKKKGTFQHSSFLAGGATSAAGRLVVENGFLKVVWPHSGHYRPTEENFKEFVSFLEENNVDLTDVKKSPIDEDEYESCPSLKRNSLSEKDLLDKANTAQHDQQGLSKSSVVKARIPNLLIPKRPVLIESAESKTRSTDWHPVSSMVEPKLGSKVTWEESSDCQDDYPFQKKNLFEEADQEVEEELEVVPPESILERYNTKNGMKSYQLGKKLSFKWTTGAGPRIGCVRDFPSELQFRALEQVHLSPRGSGHSRLLSPHPAAAASPKPSPSLLRQCICISSSNNTNNNSTTSSNNNNNNYYW